MRSVNKNMIGKIKQNYKTEAGINVLVSKLNNRVE